MNKKTLPEVQADAIISPFQRKNPQKINSIFSGFNDETYVCNDAQEIAVRGADITCHCRLLCRD
jgi:hypothetical protein